MILHCKNGNHEWEKTGRGRPPESCPEHRIQKSFSVPKMISDIEKETGKEVIYKPIPDKGPYVDHSSGVPTIVDRDHEHKVPVSIVDNNPHILMQPGKTNDIDIESVTEASTRTLHCEYGGGHDWQAPVQRGRRPKLCPDHAPLAAQKPAQRITNTKTQTISLARILENPSARLCRCGIEETTSPAELRAMKGCCDPYYVCNTLDSCRRAVGI